MIFQNPSAWWGIIGLLIPIIILLLSKKKQDTIHFGSLKFLEETQSQSFRSIFPTQWLKFLIRTLIILTLVTIIATPAWKKVQPAETKIYVENRVFNAPDFETVKNKIIDQEFQLFTYDKKWENAEISYYPSAWTFLHHLNNSMDSSIIYSYNQTRHFQGSPVFPSEKIVWKTVYPSEPFTYKDTVQLNNTTYALDSKIDEEGVKWNWKEILNAKNIRNDTVITKVISSSRLGDEATELKKILRSISELLPIELFEKSGYDGIADWTFILDTTASFESGNIVLWEINSLAPEIHEVAPNYYNMIGSLSPDYLQESNFALTLGFLLMKENFGLKEKISSPFPIEKIQKLSNKSIDSKDFNYAKTGQPIWWTILCILIILERWLAIKFIRQ